jgi:hypothetical protein
MLRVLASIYALLTAWLVSTFWHGLSLINCVLAVASCVAAIGLWMRRYWARYFVYGVSLVTVVFMILVFIYAWIRGTHYGSATQSIIGSIPGICIILYGVFSSWYVFRKLSPRS